MEKQTLPNFKTDPVPGSATNSLKGKTGNETKLAVSNLEVQEKFQKLITENDSVVYKYRKDISPDSIGTFIIKPDYTFNSDAVYMKEEGRWQLDKSEFTMFVNGHVLMFNVLLVDDKSLVMQNINGKKIYKLFFEKN